MYIPIETLPLLKCGFCKKYLSYFPIYIGENKSQICGRCIEKVPKNQTFIQDNLFESFVKIFEFPCIYDNEGCPENLCPSEVPIHEKVCPLRIVFCPLDCKWQGKVGELRGHIEQSHPKTILQKGKFEMELVDAFETDAILIFNDELFTFKRKFDEAEGVLTCSLFCHRVTNTTIQYNYEITLENENHTEKFPPKSAENFLEENATKISLEDINEKLEDPAIVGGSVRIFEEVKTQSDGEKIEQSNPEINIKMLRALECPVCFEYIAPPIFQCTTGHSICSECKVKVQECPTCKGTIGDTHNYDLEEVAELLTYPCKFVEFGCVFAAKPDKIKQHQKYCLYGPQECPLKESEDCKWKNAAKNLFRHIVKSHQDNVLEMDSVDVFIGEGYFDKEEASSYILKFTDSLFRLHYLYKEKTFHWAMQLIGPPERVVDYQFQVDVVDNSNKNRRIFLRNFCAPLSEEKKAFDDVSRYVYVKLDQVQPFIPADRLTFKVRLMK